MKHTGNYISNFTVNKKELQMPATATEQNKNFGAWVVGVLLLMKRRERELFLYFSLS